MNKIILIPTLFLLGACNFVNLKPGTMDKNQIIYADRGGYSMKHHVKDVLENRGYHVVVGKQKSSGEFNITDGNISSIGVDTNDTMGARYIIRVNERSETFMPIWCVFNGAWWWRFNVSITDNKTGQEILDWSGRGCRNSSLRKLDRYLDKLEISNIPN